MKARIVFSILALVLLNSCIVKSLFPFFTSDTISFEKQLVGTWTDNETNTWKIIGLKEKIEQEEGKDNSEQDKEDLKIFEDYLNGYYIERIENEIKSTFLAVPFKVNNQLFIDFMPFARTYEFKEVPKLVSYHFVTTHSLVKVDIEENNNINLRWLNSNKIETLLDEKRIKIKHIQTFDFPNSYLLTASSEELQEFIKKYMASNDNEKWTTDVKYTLKSNAKS